MMPVLDPPSEDPVGPYARLSHTQADMHRRCPKMWYNRYILGLLGGSPPIFAMGHAVEGALNRVMRDSPVLVSHDSPSETFDSPLEEVDISGTGNVVVRPSTQANANWPGLNLPTLDVSEWPRERLQITTWAKARARIHFEREWAQAKKEWLEDPNRVGDWDVFEEKRKEEACQMVFAGIEFHLDEVENCMKANGGPTFKDWRAGKNRPKWPAPDGFPYTHSITHPCAESSGEITFVEAWEVARPWFCDPDAGLFALAAIHPEGWLQGEYDLVYRWTGSPRIHDVKASVGTSDFSFGYPEQLATYAYLWWSTHDRKELVTELEIWYLGVPVRKKIHLPDEKSLIRLENRLKPLHKKLKMSEHNPENEYPGNPAPVRTFAPGGVLTDSPPLTGMARCDSCEYQLVCSESPHKEELLKGGSTKFSPTSEAQVNCTPIGDIDPFVTVRGTVREPNMVKQWPKFEKEYLEFFLDIGPGEWLAVVIRQDNPNIPFGFEHGATVRIKNGIIASGWKKSLGAHKRLDVSASGTIELAPKSSEDDVSFAKLIPEEYTVHARLYNFNHQDGKWAAKLIDETGSASFQVWGGDEKSRAVLEGYNPERGDEVVLVGAQAKDQYGQIVLQARVTKTFATRLRPKP